MSHSVGTSSSTADQGNKQTLSATDGLPSDPGTWSESDVVAWLNKCNLEKYAPVFQENEIDGSVLLDDSFDDAQIQKLIPIIKHQLLFNKERKKLQASDSLTTQLPVTNKSDGSHNVRTLPFLNVRLGSKASCRLEENEHSTVRLVTAKLLEPEESVHCLPITNVLNTEASSVLTKIFQYLSPVVESNEFDPDFTTIVEEPINIHILLQSILRSRSIKSYVIDSLKRCHSLSDIASILSSFLASAEHDKAPESFLDIIEHITKYVLTVCTIESLSYDSQRFLGNMLRKNSLPIPLAYYTCDKDALQFKINFNPLAETLCYSHERILLCIGSPTAIGLGKTSILSFLFENIKSDLLNTKGIGELRLGCIDTLFASFTNNNSYVVFDVHGTMTTMNEDLVTAIQQHCDAQMIFVTIDDLENRDFLRKIMNYSNETRTKPTMIVVLDSNYGERNNNFSVDQFQQAFSGEGWCHLHWMTAPTLNRINAVSDFNKEQKLLRLRQTLLDNFKSLLTSTHSNKNCRYIFAIQACFLAIKSKGNVSSILYTLEIEEKIKSFFDPLSDKTNNLQKITPISYLDSEKLMVKNQLFESWEESSVDLQKRLQAIENQYQTINRIPDFMMFFIDLITKHSYIDLLIMERFLEQWRAQYEPPLSGQIRTVKNDAMTVMSRIKRLEEKLKQSIKQKKDSDEIKNIENEIKIEKEQYKKHQDRTIEIEKQLSNIDITIGLFCDEVFALYECLPKLFESDNLTERLARKFAKLMCKGFAFHILRGRPLRCSSKLIQLSLQYVNPASKKAPLVVTVIGEQSSAKSSLMNTTFGCNFRVSAGRCTLGIYLSVIRWHDQTIVILDTEGLLSLEESGSIFDNQMITLAMLSSHLILINHKGECSSNFEHLIGISFYAKLQIRSPLKPKLLFILRDQADTNAIEIFVGQFLELKRKLYKESQFLKSSIDDEIEISPENIILLPSAFSNDFNDILKVEQIWRNGIFPKKVNELRTKLSENLDRSDTQIYQDVPQLFQKIASNWDAIDRLGPNLLACKTLHELSIVNELKEIARKIIEDCITVLNNDGQQIINDVLSGITSENCSSSDIDHRVKQFDTKMKLIYDKILEKAYKDYESKTERSCFPADIKEKVKKIIEPQIANMQGMLRERFDDRLYRACREARTSAAKTHLMEVVQKAFDNYKTLGLDSLYKTIDDRCSLEIKTCLDTLEQQLVTELRITKEVLKFYNATLQSKTANTMRGSIYNLLSSLNVDTFQQTSKTLMNIYNYVIEEREPPQLPKNSAVRRNMGVFRSGNSDHAPKQCLDEVYKSVEEYWFHDKRYDNDNKKLLRMIINNVLPSLRDNIQKIVRRQSLSSSIDPRVMTDLFAFIENAYNNQIIQTHSNCLQAHMFLFHIAVITLNILIAELFNLEQRRHEQEKKKVKEDMNKWKEDIKTQISCMQNSFDQGRNMAELVVEQIFEQTSSALLDKMVGDISKDIAKSHFINHEAVQKQAYEESFGLGNGEKILKYVLDINRYFCELSLREINPKFEATIRMHTQNMKEILMNIFIIANKTTQQTQQKNVRLIADEIEKSIAVANKLNTNHHNRLTLNSLISVPVQDLSLFKKGFETLLDAIGNITDRVAKSTHRLRIDAYAECRKRISRQLGCQSRCPRCGVKCSLPEPHGEEAVEQWHECRCEPEKCNCARPQPVLLKVHGTPHHIAEAFHGVRYHEINTPVLKLCYQQWMTMGVWISDDGVVRPLKKYYNQHHPEWYNNLQELSTTGPACKEDHPPPEQRRAWMIVRHVLLARYASYGMVDQKTYDKKLYPDHPDKLTADFQVKWHDTLDEET